MIVYFVPIKRDKTGEEAGHIMFLPTPYQTMIYESNYYPSIKPTSHKIGWFDGKVDEKMITHWCYSYFKSCSKHPAIIKVDTKNMSQELYMDDYIEDFVKDNYDEIMERLQK